MGITLSMTAGRIVSQYCDHEPFSFSYVLPEHSTDAPRSRFHYTLQGEPPLNAPPSEWQIPAPAPEYLRACEDRLKMRRFRRTARQGNFFLRGLVSQTTLPSVRMPAPPSSLFFSMKMPVIYSSENDVFTACSARIFVCVRNPSR